MPLIEERVNSARLAWENAVATGSDTEERAKALQDAEATLADAENLSRLAKNAWEISVDSGAVSILRINQTSFFYIQMLSTVLLRLKTTLGGLFLAVGLLICYSIVTRLVNDQKKQIGMKKALGFSTGEILRPYLIFSGTAVLIGGGIGTLLAYFFVEPAMIHTLATSYTFEKVTDWFGIRDFLFLFGAVFLLLEGITLLGCLRILRKPAVLLLTGSNEKSVRPARYESRSWFLRLPVSTRAIIRNCLHDGRRFFATVIGVGCCVMLLMTPLSIRNNVLKGEEKQFNTYFQFDRFVFFDGDDPNARENVENVLKQLDIPYAAALRTYVFLSSDHFPEKTAALMVFEDCAKGAERIRVESDREDTPYTGTGFWIPVSLQKEYRLNDRELLSVRTVNGSSLSVPADGYFRSYLYDLTAFWDRATYESALGKSFSPNVFVIQSAGVDFQLLSEALNETDGFIQMQNYYESSYNDAQIFLLTSNVLVGVYSGMALVLSFFVLLNLLTTFAEEKKKELIILMVNGFSVGQAKRYLGADTVFLSAIGVVAGIIGGGIFARISIASFESEYVSLIHRFDWVACAIGVAITALLTGIMSVLALRRIPKWKAEDLDRK